MADIALYGILFCAAFLGVIWLIDYYRIDRHKKKSAQH